MWRLADPRDAGGQKENGAPQDAASVCQLQRFLRLADVLATGLALTTGLPATLTVGTRPVDAAADVAAGFCYFNNSALAAALLTQAGKRTAILDIDVHHGNGTEDILCDDERVLMVSFFQHPLFPYTGTHPLGRNMVNVPLMPRSDGSFARAAVTEKWLPALEAFRPELLFISDSHADRLSCRDRANLPDDVLAAALLDGGEAGRLDLLLHLRGGVPLHQGDGGDRRRGEAGDGGDGDDRLPHGSASGCFDGCAASKAASFMQAA